MSQTVSSPRSDSVADGSRSAQPSCSVEIVPRQPGGGCCGGLGAVAEHSNEVLERRDAVELGAVDEAHEEVAHAGTVECLEEESVLAMEDCLLEGTLTNIVVQRCARLAQEEGQRDDPGAAGLG